MPEALGLEQAAAEGPEWLREPFALLREQDPTPFRFESASRLVGEPLHSHAERAPLSLGRAVLSRAVALVLFQREKLQRARRLLQDVERPRQPQRVQLERQRLAEEFRPLEELQEVRRLLLARTPKELPEHREAKFRLRLHWPQLEEQRLPGDA